MRTLKIEIPNESDFTDKVISYYVARIATSIKRGNTSGDKPLKWKLSSS